MLMLVIHLPGHFIDDGHKVWEWFLILRKLIDILLSKTLQIECKSIIENLSSEYLKSRKLLFPSETFKPKHHYFLYYADILLISGPIVSNWCMRFEAKHRELICYARNSRNRRNLPLPLAIRYSFSLSYLWMEKRPLQDIV